MNRATASSDRRNGVSRTPASAGHIENEVKCKEHYSVPYWYRDSKLIFRVFPLVQRLPLLRSFQADSLINGQRRKRSNKHRLINGVCGVL